MPNQHFEPQSPPDPEATTDFAELRREMVKTQLVSRGIQDPRVLDAMSRVPRELFVLPEYRAHAYDDRPLPIGLGQTISQPFTVAFMAEALRLRSHERVLEIGGGSGYAAAVLAQLAAHVHTIERIAKLAEMARRNLQAAGIGNVTVHHRDGSMGLAEFQPFDAIVLAAAAEQIPHHLVDQLAEGGRLLVPVGPQETGQRMLRVTRYGDRVAEEDLGLFSFVPMVEGADGLPEEEV